MKANLAPFGKDAALDSAEFTTFAVRSTEAGYSAVHGEYKLRDTQGRVSEHMFLVTLSGEQEDKTRSSPEMTFHGTLGINTTPRGQVYVAFPDLLALSAQYPQPVANQISGSSNIRPFIEQCSAYLKELEEGKCPVLLQPLTSGIKKPAWHFT